MHHQTGTSDPSANIKPEPNVTIVLLLTSKTVVMNICSRRSRAVQNTIGESRRTVLHELLIEAKDIGAGSEIDVDLD